MKQQCPLAASCGVRLAFCRANRRFTNRSWRQSRAEREQRDVPVGRRASNSSGHCRAPARSRRGDHLAQRNADEWLDPEVRSSRERRCGALAIAAPTPRPRARRSRSTATLSGCPGMRTAPDGRAIQISRIARKGSIGSHSYTVGTRTGEDGIWPRARDGCGTIRAKTLEVVAHVEVHVGQADARTLRLQEVPGEEASHAAAHVAGPPVVLSVPVYLLADVPSGSPGGVSKR